MFESVKRSVYRVGRNFAALIFIQMTIDFLIGPIGYVVGLFNYGWYALAPWQIKLMFTSPLQNITEFVFMATLILAILGILKAPFVLFKTVRNFYSLRAGKYSIN